VVRGLFTVGGARYATIAPPAHTIGLGARGSGTLQLLVC